MWLCRCGTLSPGGAAEDPPLGQEERRPLWVARRGNTAPEHCTRSSDYSGRPEKVTRGTGAGWGSGSAGVSFPEFCLRVVVSYRDSVLFKALKRSSKALSPTLIIRYALNKDAPHTGEQHVLELCVGSLSLPQDAAQLLTIVIFNTDFHLIKRCEAQATKNLSYEIVGIVGAKSILANPQVKIRPQCIGGYLYFIECSLFDRGFLPVALALYLHLELLGTPCPRSRVIRQERQTSDEWCLVL